MALNKQQIIDKTIEIVISQNPQLAIKSIRCNLSPIQKSILVSQMLDIAQNLEIMNG